jgi:hypothetical protein
MYNQLSVKVPAESTALRQKQLHSDILKLKRTCKSYLRKVLEVFAN